MDQNNGLITLSERKFEIDDVLDSSFTRDQHRTDNFPRKKEWDGFFVNMDSLRYATFKRSGTKCVWCGLEGKFFLLQTFKGHLPGVGHFNLYGQEEDGSLVMMTRDHVIPRAKGGTDRVRNLVTMCFNCNCLKADRTDIVLDGEEDWLGQTWFERELLIPWLSVRQALRNAGRNGDCMMALRDFLAYYDKYDGKMKAKQAKPLRRWMYDNGRILFEMVKFHQERTRQNGQAQKA